MKVLVDENIPTMCVDYLRTQGHDVVDVRGTREEGLSDDALWKKAQRDKALLITTDRGFARRRSAAHSGILVVRLRRPNRRLITQRVIEAMQLFRPEEWANLLVIMRDTVLSSWRIPTPK